MNSTETRDHQNGVTGPLTEAELHAALPGFGGFRCLHAGGDFARYGATHSSGQDFTVFVAPARLGGWVAADGACFLPDAQAAMALRHPHLASMFHFARAGQHSLLVTEKLEGPTLGQLLREKRIDARGAFEIMTQVCDAVRHAHEAGVLHRALNPECLHVDEKGAVKVFGFGFANLFFEHWQAEIRGGRVLAYVPVELHLPGMAAATPRSDIFALGVIHYLIFTGGLPKGSFFTLPSQSARVETYLDDAVLRAMHSKIENRPESVAELIEELSGRRRRAWDAPSASSTSLEFGTPGHYEEHSADGALGWIRSWMVWATVFVLLATGALGTYIIYERKKIAESVDDDALNRFLAKVSEGDQQLRAGQRTKGLSTLTGLSLEMPVDIRTLGKLIDVLISHGEYEEALSLGQNALKRQTGDGKDLEAMLARFGDTKQDIEDFRTMQRLAALAHLEGKPRIEHAALRKAAATMPLDQAAAEELRDSPVTLQDEILAVLSILRERNPSQASWRWQVRIRRGYAELDLSGNEALHDISALAGSRIRALDLSGTAVADLSALQDLPLDRLALNRTRVTSLEALASLPLRLLTFDDAPVAEAPSGEWFSGLASVRGSIGGAKVVRIGPPESDLEWENPLGMRFRPLPGGRTLLAERETTVAAFRAFVTEHGGGEGAEFQAFVDGAWRTAEGDWEKPGFPSGDAYPVVGVSALEAETFCEWLTERDRRSGALTGEQRYRLPLDLEWSEAAGRSDHPLLGPLARARLRDPEGGKRPHSTWVLEFSEGLPREGSFLESLTADAPWIRPVATLRGEGEGFHDLAGNAREWCADTVDSQHRQVVVRGGGSERRRGDTVSRDVVPRAARLNDLGFRVALQLAPVPDPALLPNLLAKGEWERARAEALHQAAQGENAHLREAGAAFLEWEPLLEAENRREYLGAISGLQAFGGNHYGVVRIPMRWEEADKFATRLGGHLAVLTSGEETDFVTRHFVASDEGPGAWIGAVQREENDAWEWSTGDEPSYLKEKTREVPAAKIASADDSRGLMLAAAPVTAEPAPARWLSARRSEAHCFLVEWEGGAAPSLAARDGATP